MKSLARWFAWLLLSVAACGVASAQEKPRSEKPTPEPWLQELLKRFPEADANKDGVLTREEAQAYRRKLEAERAEKTTGKSAAEAVKPTFADVKYGPYERNVIDFYQAKSQEPAPLVNRMDEPWVDSLECARVERPHTE